MPMDFTKLFGESGAVLGPTLSTNFFESRTWIAPQDGIVIVRGMGAGGGGARGVPATGGYSGSWGCKIVRVKKDDTISVAIGAGGIGRFDTNGDGTAGGDTIITISGVQYIAYGGPGGVVGATGPLPDGPSPSANWDFGASSVKAGWVTDGRTGGAGVDILAQGNNATASGSIGGGNGTGGGGTGGASKGVTGGGAMPGGKSALGSGPANPAVVFDASQGEWGISFYGGGGATGTTAPGGNGGGGAVGGNTSGAGGNGGGGGGAIGTNGGGAGGIGGGGGAGNVGGPGGQGFAHLKFYADMGV